MKKSFYKCFKSFGFAWKGIAFVIKHENNMRYHIIATIGVTVAGVIVQLSRIEWIAITIAIGIVWLAEVFNTAIEKLVDLVSPSFNQKAGLIKDIASGAVLLAAITAFTIGLFVFSENLKFN